MEHVRLRRRQSRSVKLFVPRATAAQHTGSRRYVASACAEQTAHFVGWLAGETPETHAVGQNQASCQHQPV